MRWCMCACVNESCDSPSASACDAENPHQGTLPQRSAPATLTFLLFGRLRPGSMGIVSRRVHVTASHGANTPLPDREKEIIRPVWRKRCPRLAAEQHTQLCRRSEFSELQVRNSWLTGCRFSLSAPEPEGWDSSLVWTRVSRRMD